MIRYFGLAAAVALTASLASPARAQPASQSNSVLYCPTGQYDGFGNPLVAPCGFQGNPVEVNVIPNTSAPAVTPTVQCPANPLSKKIPPLC